MEDDGVCKAFKSDILRVATSVPMVQTITNMIIKVKTLMAPVAVFIAKQATEDVSEAAQQSLLAV